MRGRAPRGGVVGVLPEGGYLVATLRFEVEPEPRLLSLVERYTQALRHAIHLLLEHRVTSLGAAHRLPWEARGMAPKTLRRLVAMGLAWEKSHGPGRRSYGLTKEGARLAKELCLGD